MAVILLILTRDNRKLATAAAAAADAPEFVDARHTHRSVDSSCRSSLPRPPPANHTALDRLRSTRQ